MLPTGILVGMANDILYAFLYPTSIDPKAAQTLTKLQLFVKKKYTCTIFFHIIYFWIDGLSTHCMKDKKLYQFEITLTWLLQFLKLCSPKPFRGITTDTIGKFDWAECSRSFMLSHKNAKLWPSSFLRFICLITLFLWGKKPSILYETNINRTTALASISWQSSQPHVCQCGLCCCSV